MSEELLITKQCIKCEETFPLDNFNKNVKTKDGFQNECKKCINARAQLYYQKNKKRIIKRVVKHKLEIIKNNKKQAKELKKAAKQDLETVISSPIFQVN